MIVTPCTLVTPWTNCPSLMLPHAPPASKQVPYSHYIMWIRACCFFFSCLLFNSHMPPAQFMLLTLLMSVIPPILFTCFMLLTHFSIIFLIFLCLSLYTSYISHDSSSFMLNFYLFTESCSCYFIHDHYLSTYVTCFIPCLNLFLIHFCPLFFSCFTVLILTSHRFLLLIDFSSSSYLLHSFMLPLVLASLALAMVTSCPFLPCVFMFTHLGINACPLHLLLLNVSSAHSSTTQSSCRFFPSLVATCIFETYLQFTPHWPLALHMLMTYLLISL